MTGRLQWLRERQRGIGGSDAPALVLSPEQYKWKRPEDVLADKVYPIEDEGEERLCCRIGHELEDFAARLFTEVTGLKVRKDGRHFVHPEHPFMVGNIDRKIVGHNWGLECKTTSAYNGNKFTEDSYPLEYFVQIQHYLAVTGWEKWYLSAICSACKDDFYIEMTGAVEKDLFLYSYCPNCGAKMDGGAEG